MTKQTLTYFALSMACMGLVLGASAALAQDKLAGPRGRLVPQAAKSTTNFAARSFPEPLPTPGGASVVDFGTLDFPGTSDSAGYDINDLGQFTGGYGADLEVSISDTGFFLSNDAFKKISFPGATQTASFGLNNTGEIVGSYYDTAGNEHGFSLIKGVYTSIDVPGAILTQVEGVNDSGEIVGLYYTSDPGIGYSFYLLGSTYTTIAVAGAQDTFAGGVNNSGEIVGQWVDSAGNYHGFSWTSGVFTTIDYPGAVYSSVLGINDQGDVAGEYGNGDLNQFAGLQHGFVYGKGHYLKVDVPFVGSAVTWLNGINKDGQISGFYVDTVGRFYGFTAKVVP
jgi:uncharacterized membrane protein